MQRDTVGKSTNTLFYLVNYNAYGYLILKARSKKLRREQKLATQFVIHNYYMKIGKLKKESSNVCLYTR